MLKFSSLALLMWLTACAAPAPLAPESTVIECSEPRPQVCTMEYNPVCAHLSGGGQKEFASACNACASDAVGGYVSGACEE